MSPNVPKRPQTSPNVPKRPQTSPNVLNMSPLHANTSPNVLKRPQMSPNVPKHPQTSPNVPKGSQTSPNVPKRPSAELGSAASLHVRNLPAASGSQRGGAHELVPKNGRGWSCVAKIIISNGSSVLICLLSGPRTSCLWISLFIRPNYPDNYCNNQITRWLLCTRPRQDVQIIQR